MTSRQKGILLGAVILSGGFGLVEARIILRQHHELEASQTAHASLEKRIATLARERDAITRELAAAERQLAQLGPAAAAPKDTSATRDLEIKNWLGRVSQLRRLFAERPTHRIPELQLLTDEDWLNVTRELKLDSEEDKRKTLAGVRAEAKRRFTAQLADAFRKFRQTGADELPATPRDLASYFDPPVDPAIFDRYEMLVSGKLATHAKRTDPIIREKTAIDEDYDSRPQISMTGWGANSGLLAWMEGFQPKDMTRAFTAFSAANPGVKPESMAEVVPYIDPPLSPENAARMVRYIQQEKR